MSPRVGIIETNSYDEQLVYERVKTLVENTDFPMVEGKIVLIKPNVLYDSKPEKAISTHPSVVKAVVRILQERKAKEIWIGESPAVMGGGFKAQAAGMADVVRETEARWVDFMEEPVTRKLWNGIKVPQTKYLDECDLVFSICKMKTHQLMYATGAVKNMFGTVPGFNKSPLHLHARSPENFAKLLLSIFRTHVPEWSLMDGIVAMEGTGPSNGTPRQVNLLLASSSALALDRAQAIIMNYDPKDIPILSEAEREEKGSTSGIYPILKPEDLRIPDFKTIPVKKRNLFQSLVLPLITSRLDRWKASRRPAPEFLSDKCRKCRRCMEICPAKALELVEGKIEITQRKCIRCYCCHEVCPFDAIAIKEK